MRATSTSAPTFDVELGRGRALSPTPTRPDTSTARSAARAPRPHRHVPVESTARGRRALILWSLRSRTCTCLRPPWPSFWPSLRPSLWPSRPCSASSLASPRSAFRIPRPASHPLNALRYRITFTRTPSPTRHRVTAQAATLTRVHFKDTRPRATLLSPCTTACPTQARPSHTTRPPQSTYARTRAASAQTTSSPAPNTQARDTSPSSRAHTNPPRDPASSVHTHTALSARCLPNLRATRPDLPCWPHRPSPHHDPDHLHIP